MKTKITFIALLLCNLIWSTAKANENEPNDTKAQANTLQLNGSNSGTIGTVGDNDWYKVTTTADGRLRLMLTPQGSLDVYARLYDHDGTTQLGQIEAYSGNAAVLNKDGLAPGTYYVQLFPYSTSTGAYTIADSLFKPKEKNDAEPNNYAKKAITLGEDSSTEGHLNYYYDHTSDNTDWYVVNIKPSGNYRITLSALNGADFYARLYRSDTTTQLGTVESYSNNPAVLNANGIKTGTYYIQIFPYSNSFGTYTLADTLIKPDQHTDIEPNNYAKDADTLLLNGQQGGKLGYTSGSKVDRADWYKVTTKSDGLLRVTLSAQNGADFYARLFDNDTTTQLGTIESYSNNPAVLNVNGLAAGTYYIELFPYSTSFGTYTLADSSFAPMFANDDEPNNYAKKAVTLPLNKSKTGHLDYYYNGTRDNSDWYKITTNKDGYLKLTFLAADGGDLYMRLYDKDTVTQISTVESLNGNTVTINADGLAKGTYYVQLFPYSTSFGSYKITDNLYTYNTADNEPDNYPYQAATIANKDTVTGDIDFHYNNNNDNVDWWKIHYTGAANGSMTINYKLLPHLSDNNYGDIYFYVYSDTSGSPVSSIELYGSNNTTTVTINSLQPGNYWVKVVPYGTSFSAYSISPKWSGSAPAVNNDFNIASKSLLNNPIGVAPNPVSSYFIIHYKNVAQNKINASLYDANGKAVWNSGLLDANALDGKKVNTTAFAKGVFFLKVINENGNVDGTVKVIISQ